MVRFKQDNTRPHIARLCDPVSATSNIDMLDMSSLSPDLSQTEMSLVVWCTVGNVTALRQAQV